MSDPGARAHGCRKIYSVIFSRILYRNSRFLRLIRLTYLGRLPLALGRILPIVGIRRIL